MQLLVQFAVLLPLLLQLQHQFVNHKMLLLYFPTQALPITFTSAFRTLCLTYLNSQFYNNANIFQQYSNSATAMSTFPRCLKEYTCFEYQNMIRSDFEPVRSSPAPLKFKGNTPCIFQELKYEIIDRLHPDGQEKMYICKWQVEIGNNTHLYFLDFRLNQMRKISMSGQPKFFHIVGEHVYIVGGSDLFVLSIDRLEPPKVFPLGADIIHAVQPTFKQSDLNSRGVAIYSWNQRRGYTKRFFSPQDSHEEKWWAGLTSTIMLKKAPQQLIGSELKIIIPNVLGLVILPSLDEICLMNLAAMQPVAHCSRKLSNWSFSKPSKAIIKYYVNRNSDRFDDSLLISVAEKDEENIEIFIFHIKYSPDIASKIKALKEQSQSEQIGLPSMTTGEVVDWNASVLQHFFTYSTEGALIDYLLVEKGLIFYSNANSKIPNSGFINYSSPLHLNPILALEHNICQSFVTDSQLANRIAELKKGKQTGGNENYEENEQLADYQEQLMNSILRPNRYSLQFLYASLGAEPVNQIVGKNLNVKNLFFNWHKLYRVKKVVKFDGDILVLRENSISSFLSIDSKQFISEFQNGEQLAKYLQVSSDRNSVASFDLSVNESNYSFNLPSPAYTPWDSTWKDMNEFQNAAFTYEKQGTFFNTQNEGPVTKDYCQNYEKYLTIFLEKISTVYSQPMENIFQSQQITLKSQVFSKLMIQNRVKDLLLFYCKLLRYLFAKTKESHRHECERGSLNRKQKLLINYLSGLTKIVNQPLHQVCAHGADLIQIFVTQEINNLCLSIEQQRGIDQSVTVFVNVEKQCWKIISKIFQQVVVANPKSSQVNSFIKLLLNYIKSGYQYIQYILLEIFNPYSNFQLADQPVYDVAHHSQLLSARSSRAIHSNEQSHFPFTSTLLSIYCYFPISDDIQDKLMTSCILPNLLAQGSQKTINQLLSEVVGSKNFKDRLRTIYNQSKEARKPYELKFATERSDRGFSKSLPNKQEEQMQNFDSSLGIVELAKLLEPQALQRKLACLKEEELDSVFRVNIESLLGGKSEREQAVRYTNEQMLVGWIFKYRTYVEKFKKIMSDIATGDKEDLKDRNINNTFKQIASNYANFCLSSLASIKAYYNKLYVNLRAVLPYHETETMSRPQQEFEDSLGEENEWELIEKVCCRMVGYQSSHGLYFYQKTDKVYPDSGYFTLVLPILKDFQSYAQSITSVDSIIFYYLLKISQETKESDTEGKIEWLKSLGRYRSRKQLCEFIMKNGVLRSGFEKIEDEQLVRQIKVYLPYCEEMGLAIGAHPKLNGLKLRNYQKANGQNNLHQLPFRNSYLEAVGR